MKTWADNRDGIILSLIILLTGRSPAATLYVATNSPGPAAPYASWATAATNIQTAVNTASAGDFILVSNGVYQTGSTSGSRVYVNKALTLQSVNGPAATVIQGYQVPGTTNGSAAIRCVYLNTLSATLSGFTLTNGATYDTDGGGACCSGTNNIITNCIITGNAAGGGGGVYYGTCNNCQITGNTSFGLGGGVFYGVYNGCTISGNINSASGALGGGGYGGIYNNCQITGNTCSGIGGGVVCQSGSWPDAGKFTDCIIAGNTSLNGNGGGLYAYATGSLSMNNCVIAGNTCLNGSGEGVYGVSATAATLTNCTIVNNHTTGGSSLNVGVYNGTLYNCIIFYNNYKSVSPAIFTDVSSGTILQNCCTYFTNFLAGSGNLTNLPGIIDPFNGNYRLQIGSPLIGAGNLAYAPAVPDPDGNPRSLDGTVDLGAYESDYTNIVHFVSLTNTAPVPPYTNWATAATNIQTAISVAQPGEIVAVGPGIYNAANQGPGIVISGQSTNCVAVTNGVTLLSVYGPQATRIVGQAQLRCAYVDSTSVLEGFTLTNGQTGLTGDPLQDQSGGGVWCQSLTALVSNCVMTADSAAYAGGGACSGPLVTCTLTNDPATAYGGGAFLSALKQGSLWNNRYGNGAGACSNTLNNCLLAGNSLATYGGGAYACTLNNCTLSNNSASYGGGACVSVLNNCLLTNNRAGYNGGAGCSNTLNNCTVAGNGAANGGGTYASFVTNSTFTGNSARNGGAADLGVLSGCTLITNRAYNGGATATNAIYNSWLINNLATNNGGAACGGSLSGSTILGNIATNNGGGTAFVMLTGCLGGTYQANATNCTYYANYAGSGGGGAALGICSGCFLTNNLSSYGGGIYSNTAYGCFIGGSNRVALNMHGGGSYGSTLSRCWLYMNSGGGSAYDTLSDCIVYFNYNGMGVAYGTANNCTIWGNGQLTPLDNTYNCNLTNSIIYGSINNCANSFSGYISYCCTTPLPAGGVGNFTNAPIFADNNFDPATNSPTIGAGNISFAAGTVDYNGRPRTLNGTVDVGAQQFQGATVEPFISWLGQYSLPVDGSVDYTDSDGTGLNNWQKYLAGLNPTNPASVLKIFVPPPTNSSAGYPVTWQSVTNVTYSVQRSPGLAPPAFVTLQTNIPGQSNTTTYLDTTATRAY